MSTMLCGRTNGGCCPSISKDKKTGITYIVDGDQKIGFTTEQLYKLCEYLDTHCACKCKSCKHA